MSSVKSNATQLFACFAFSALQSEAQDSLSLTSVSFEIWSMFVIEPGRHQYSCPFSVKVSDAPAYRNFYTHEKNFREKRVLDRRPTLPKNSAKKDKSSYWSF